MDITGIGAVADLANNIIGKLWPDKSDQEKQQLAMALTMIQGQLTTNQAEAVHPSTFVSGWRPFIGWVCGCACAWNWIGLSVIKTIATAIGVAMEMSPASLGEMMPVLIGMLGLGAYRTFEKTQGVAAK